MDTSTNHNQTFCWQSPIDKHIEVVYQVPDELNPGQIMEVGFCKFCGRKIKEYRKTGGKICSMKKMA